MGLLDIFRQNKTNSASQAKDRLQILVAHERSERNRPSYLPQLKQDLIEVISKYVQVEQSAVDVHYDNDGEHEILELNITLPEHH